MFLAPIKLWVSGNRTNRPSENSAKTYNYPQKIFYD